MQRHVRCVGSFPFALTKTGPAQCGSLTRSLKLEGASTLIATSGSIADVVRDGAK